MRARVLIVGALVASLLVPTLLATGNGAADAAPATAVVSSGGGGSGSSISGGSVITRIADYVRGRARPSGAGPRCVWRTVPNVFYAAVIELIGTLRLEGYEIPDEFEPLLAPTLTPENLLVTERFCRGSSAHDFRVVFREQSNAPWVAIVGRLMITVPRARNPVLTPDLTVEGDGTAVPVPVGQRVFATVDPADWQPHLSSLVYAGRARSVLLTPETYTFDVAGVVDEHCRDVPGPGRGFDPDRGVETQAEDPTVCSFVVPRTPPGGWPALAALTVTWRAEELADGGRTLLGRVPRTTVVQLFARQIDTAIRHRPAAAGSASAHSKRAPHSRRIPR